MSTKLLTQITLPADPTAALEAATKQYVDSHAGGGGGVGSRTTASFTTSSLTASQIGTGLVNLGDSYRLYTITTSGPCRTRLYTTTTKRDADLGREIGTDPVGDHGLILEFISTTSPSLLTADLSPVVDGFDGDADGMIPYSVENVSGSTATFTITFSYMITES